MSVLSHSFIQGFDIPELQESPFMLRALT